MTLTLLLVALLLVASFPVAVLAGRMLKRAAEHYPEVEG